MFVQVNLGFLDLSVCNLLIFKEIKLPDHKIKLDKSQKIRLNSGPNILCFTVSRSNLKLLMKL